MLTGGTSPSVSSASPPGLLPAALSCVPLLSLGGLGFDAADAAEVGLVTCSQYGQSIDAYGELDLDRLSALPCERQQLVHVSADNPAVCRD